MSCIKTINFAKDYEQISDVSDWMHDDLAEVSHNGAFMVFDSAMDNYEYKIDIGSITDVENLELEIFMNLDCVSTITNTKIEVDIVDTITNGVLYQSEYFFDGMTQFQNYNHFFKRLYQINRDEINLQIIIRIPQGWQNNLNIKYFNLYDVDVCESAKCYFIFEGFFSQSLSSEFAWVKLLQYEIDGVETLTTDFFNNQNLVGGSPTSRYKFAYADVDAQNRNPDGLPINCFNPFLKDLLLEYSPTNYFDGYPIGTLSGLDFGNGIMNIGVDLPEILNGNLQSTPGSFFVDIDFSKDLHIVFDVLINNTDTNPEERPFYHREYHIIWDSQRCVKRFYYYNRIRFIDVEQNQNGFLYGLTPQIKNKIQARIGQIISGTTVTGGLEFNVDYGTENGQYGIEYNSFDIPKRFTIDWNGNTFTTGFVGNQKYEQQLLDLGYPIGEINLGNPSTGFGRLYFNKNILNIRNAMVKVESPFSSKTWTVKIIKENANVVNQIGVVKSNELPENLRTIYFENIVTEKIKPLIGDLVYLDADKSTSFDGEGFKYRIKIFSNGKFYWSDYTVTINGVAEITSIDLLNPGQSPFFREVQNSCNSTTGIRTQTFVIGDNIVENDVYVLTAYDVDVQTTVTNTDTPEKIINRLTILVNDKLESDWDAQGEAPVNGTPGFPPTATENGKTITLTINELNMFTSKIT